MKLKICFLLLSIMSISCVTEANKRTESESNTFSHPQQELKHYEEDIFLGFNFRMSRNDYDRRIKRLIREEKIDASNRYVMNTGSSFSLSERLLCLINPVFYEDTLMGINLNCTVPDKFISDPTGLGIKPDELDVSAVYYMFKNKYPEPRFKWVLERFEHSGWVLDDDRKVYGGSGKNKLRVYFEKYRYRMSDGENQLYIEINEDENFVGIIYEDVLWSKRAEQGDNEVRLKRDSISRNMRNKTINDI